MVSTRLVAKVEAWVVAARRGSRTAQVKVTLCYGYDGLLYALAGRPPRDAAIGLEASFRRAGEGDAGAAA